MTLLSWTNLLTNRVTNSLAVRRLTSMRVGCKFEGISDALPLAEIFLVLHSGGPIWNMIVEYLKGQ